MKRATRFESLFVLCRYKRADFTIKPFAKMVFGNIKIILCLQSQPELGRVAKETSQPQCSIRRDGAPAKHDLVNAACVHADVNGKAVLAQAHRLDKFFQ